MKIKYVDNSNKTVLVVNAQFPAPIILNAAAHAILGLAATCDPAIWKLLPYPSVAFSTDSRISEYPVVVLRAKRSAQIEKLIPELKAADIKHNVFLDSMLGVSASQQQSATRTATSDTNRIVCVALFGASETIRPMTRSFSLYKSSDAIVDTTAVTPSEA